MATMTISDPDTHQETLKFHGCRGYVEFGSKDLDGDVEMDYGIDGIYSTHYLKPPQIKSLIAHLQKQLI